MSDNPYDITDSSIPEQWIPEDLTGKLYTNYFKEAHPVGECSTEGSSGKTVIISPYRGAFYADDDFTIIYKYGTTETVLSRTDYRFIGMDIGRTRASSSEYGVYRFVQLTYDTSSINDEGVFVITYHAFGGEIDRYAYARLVDMINAASGSGSGGGGSSSAVDPTARAQITSLSTKVDKMMSRINFNPVSNATVPRKTVTDWKAIAYSSSELDTYINLNDPKTLSGTGTFIIVSSYVHGIYTFSYEIIKTSTSYKCKFSTDVIGQKIASFDTEDSAYFGTGSSAAGTMTIPMFRMRVNTAGTLSASQHRLVIETTMLSDATDASYAMYIGDKTDALFISTTNANAGGQTFDAWEVGPLEVAGTYVTSNTVLGLQDYYKIWYGNASMKNIEDVSWTGLSISRQYNVKSTVVPTPTDNGYVVWPFMNNSIDPKSVKSFRIDVYDRWQKKLISAVGDPMVKNPYSVSSQIIGTCINYFPVDDCILELFFINDSRPVIKLYSFSGDNSYSNERFDLRAIYVK